MLSSFFEGARLLHEAQVRENLRELAIELKDGTACTIQVGWNAIRLIITSRSLVHEETSLSFQDVERVSAEIGWREFGPSVYDTAPHGAEMIPFVDDFFSSQPVRNFEPKRLKTFLLKISVITGFNIRVEAGFGSLRHKVSVHPKNATTPPLEKLRSLIDGHIVWSDRRMFQKADGILVVKPVAIFSARFKARILKKFSYEAPISAHQKIVALRALKAEFLEIWPNVSPGAVEEALYECLA